MDVSRPGHLPASSRSLGGSPSADGVANGASFSQRPLARFCLSPGVHVVVEPRRVSTKEQFLSKRPRHWICLDGRITAIPEKLKSRPFWNVDHHFGVDRLLTPCSAQQIRRELSQRRNILRSFVLAGRMKVNVAVNDCDFDVILSLWLIRHFLQSPRVALPRSMGHLVDLQDRIDRRGGCLPIDKNSRLMRAMSWLNEPYEKVRESGQLAKLSASEMVGIIQETLGRIDAFALGEGKLRAVDGRYRRIGLGGPGWVMVEEQGLYARGVMLREGVRAFISVKNKGEGRWSYALWRMHPRSTFNVSYLYRVFNAAEGLRDFSENCWGGSQEGGGSPRMTGSSLSPDQLSAVTNAYLEYARQEGFTETALDRFIEEHLPTVLEQPPKAA